jgi:hypothetical protein
MLQVATLALWQLSAVIFEIAAGKVSSGLVCGAIVVP